MKSGIYKITNIINSKVYIGSSKDYKQRLRQHRNQLKYNNHSNRHLQSSWNKYGEDNFKFEAIELVEVDKLITREKYFVYLFKCLEPKFGYNKATIIENTSGYKWTLDSRLKLSNSKKGMKIHPNTQEALIKANKNRIYKKGYKLNREIVNNQNKGKEKPILQYDLYGNFIREFNSADEASKILNVSSTNIRTCCRGERSIAFGYQWFPKFNKYPLKVPRYKRKLRNFNEFLRLCSAMNIEKQGELLENPITVSEDNQQPSLSSNTLEGSTTNSQVLNKDGNADTSALPVEMSLIDIMRPLQLYNNNKFFGDDIV